MRRICRAPIDVPLLLARLNIKAQRGARDKLVAFCPHAQHDNKRTPAWFIRDDPKSSYHATHCCKSCGFAGGAVSLVEHVLGLSREEAYEWLDELRGPAPIPVKVEAQIEQAPRYPEFCGELFGAVPIQEGDAAAEYLAGRDKPVPLEQAKQHGLCWVPGRARDEDGRPHRLRDRIVLPFRDREGRLGSYAARALERTARKRYLAPARAEGVRADAVFGEQFWGQGRVVVLFEGGFDAMAGERAYGAPGALQVAALAGSEPHPSQLLKLMQFKLVVVATDNDAAGEKAWELIRAQLSGIRPLVRAAPPQGLDYAQLEQEQIRQLLDPALRGIGKV